MTNLIYFLLTMYTIGFIVSYVILKIQRNFEDDNEWADVLITFLLSLGSFATFYIIIAVMVCNWLESKKVFKHIEKIKPFKWL